MTSQITWNWNCFKKVSQNENLFTQWILRRRCWIMAKEYSLWLALPVLIKQVDLLSFLHGLLCVISLWMSLDRFGRQPCIPAWFLHEGCHSWSYYTQITLFLYKYVDIPVLHDLVQFIFYLRRDHLWKMFSVSLIVFLVTRKVHKWIEVWININSDYYQRYPID